MVMLYHKCLGRLGYAVLIDEMDKNLIKEIKKECTVVTTVLPAFKDFQKPKRYILYYMSKDKKMLYLPRYYAMEKLGDPDYVALTKGAPINVVCKFNPLPHQANAVKKLDILFDDSNQTGAGGVLSLPCGYGKTYCAIRTVCRLGLSALIIVPTECLMDQWIDAIQQFAPEAKIGYIQRDHIDVEGKDFVVAMLHSICLKNYKSSNFERFGITIYDECHHIGSETFSKSMMKIRTRFTLGLSATPHRRDGLSPVFYNFLGPLFHKEKRKGSNRIIVKKINLYSNSENYEVLRMTNGTKNTSGMITAISKLEERNTLIVHILRELIGQGRKILIIGSRKQHLHDIKDLLDNAGIKHPQTGKYITYGFYYGKTGMTRKKHKALLATSAKCDIVLGIDRIAKEGLDIPDLNTLVWITPPGMDVEQPVGRILRRFHKDVNPTVIDFVDQTGNFVNHSRERNKWFKEENYIIQQHKVELLGKPELWQNGVISYLNRMPTKKQLEVNNFSEPEPRDDEPESEPEPDLDNCILGDEDGNKPSLKLKTKVTVKSKKRVKQKKIAAIKKEKELKEPPMDTCFVRNVRNSKSTSKPKPKPKNEPELDICLL